MALGFRVYEVKRALQKSPISFDILKCVDHQGTYFDLVARNLSSEKQLEGMNFEVHGEVAICQWKVVGYFVGYATLEFKGKW